MIPAPPHIAGEGPKPLLNGGNKAVERARLADYRSHLRGRLDEHADFVLAKDARFPGLNHEHALQKSAIDERDAEKRVVFLFARLR